MRATTEGVVVLLDDLDIAILLRLVNVVEASATSELSWKVDLQFIQKFALSDYKAMIRNSKVV